MSPHDVQQIQADPEPEIDLEGQNACAEIDGVPTHPTALNRVLQQIRVPPKMKRGTSLHSRRGKPEAPKGSPQINRKSGQEMATVMQSGRPRSSSTTDAPTSSTVMEIACAAAAAACLPGDEAPAERVSLLDFHLTYSLYLGRCKLCFLTKKRYLIKYFKVVAKDSFPFH